MSGGGAKCPVTGSQRPITFLNAAAASLPAAAAAAVATARPDVSRQKRFQQKHHISDVSTVRTHPDQRCTRRRGKNVQAVVPPPSRRDDIIYPLVCK